MACARNVAVNRRPDFSQEIQRLRSFGTWPNTAPISKEKLAKAGFYYLGNELETSCFSCKIEISDWTFGDDAARRHREKNPECQFFIQQALANRMKQLEERLSSFANWPKPNINTQRLANAGFYYTGEGDKTRCAWCKGTIENWSETDIPFEEHGICFPCCSFILNPPAYAYDAQDERTHEMNEINEINEINVNNEIANNTNEIIEFDETMPASNNIMKHIDQMIMKHVGPRYTDLVSLDVRLKTFSTWPDTIGVKPLDLAMAGFVYLGESDNTLCFHCGIKLQNWEVDDDPWKEHERWNPACYFNILNKQKTSHDNTDQEKMQSIDAGYLNLCLVCLSNEREIVYFPCGHVATCSSCTPCIINCVICRKRITNTMRIFMS